jgi:hypothetical protein
MRNYILAAAAVLVLALSVGPSLAKGKSSQGNDCADVLANQGGHSQAEIQECQAQQ